MSDAGPPPEEDIFAGMKKKKSKKVVFDDDTPSNLSPLPSVNDLPAPAADADLDFSDLKKKKKKKALPVSDDEADAPAAKTTDSYGNALEVEVVEKKEEAAEDAGGDEFSDLLKKKKKKGGKKSTFDLEAFEKELAEAEAESSPAAESAGATPIGSDGEDDGESGDDEVPEGEDPFAKETDETMSKAEAAAEAKAWIGSDRDYTYTEVLGRFYGLLYASHPSLSAAGTKKKYFLAPPQMYREGNKRSIFANIVEICKKMHRQPEHVIQFLFAELGTSGSVDGSGRLVIKGRFQQKQIENVLRRYIVEYVTCKTCKSPDTLLTKDNRLFFMTCESCGSSRSVSAIKSGFQALTGKRRAMRPAA